MQDPAVPLTLLTGVNSAGKPTVLLSLLLLRLSYASGQLKQGGLTLNGDLIRLGTAEHTRERALTHSVIVGMTGSGKTGLLTVLVEDALRSAILVMMIDIKGDLPNLLLTYPNLSPAEFAAWVDPPVFQQTHDDR